MLQPMMRLTVRNICILAFLGMQYGCVSIDRDGPTLSAQGSSASPVAVSLEREFPAARIGDSLLRWRPPEGTYDLDGQLTHFGDRLVLEADLRRKAPQIIELPHIERFIYRVELLSDGRNGALKWDRAALEELFQSGVSISNLSVTSNDFDSNVAGATSADYSAWLVGGFGEAFMLSAKRCAPMPAVTSGSLTMIAKPPAGQSRDNVVDEWLRRGPPTAEGASVRSFTLEAESVDLEVEFRSAHCRPEGNARELALLRTRVLKPVPGGFPGK